MSLLIVFVYIKPWFSTSSVTRAATSDLSLLRNLTSYRKIDKNMSASCCKVLQRHTCYFTEENIPFSLFNESLSFTELQLLAEAIISSTFDNELEPRGFRISQFYNTRLTRNEDSFQELLQVVECHRSQFSLDCKKNLKNFK